MVFTYKIGEILTSNRDIPVEMVISGKTKVIPNGSKVIIGADMLAHHFDGCIQPLSKYTTVEGYDVTGLSEWIIHCLSNEIPCLSEALENYEVRSVIENALKEIGFHGNE